MSEFGREVPERAIIEAMTGLARTVRTRTTQIIAAPVGWRSPAEPSSGEVFDQCFSCQQQRVRALRDIARLAEHKKPKPALPPSPALDGSCSNRTTSRMMSSMHGSESSSGGI